jgi:hypothetical protein
MFTSATCRTLFLYLNDSRVGVSVDMGGSILISAFFLKLMVWVEAAGLLWIIAMVLSTFSEH